MSDEPSNPGPKRDEKGHFVKGGPGGPGRKRLPDWYRDGTEDAARVVYAAATGRLAPGANPPAALPFEVKEGGIDTIDPEVRLEQANKMLDRVIGKAPDVIAGDPDSPLAVSVIRRVIVDPKG